MVQRNFTLPKVKIDPSSKTYIVVCLNDSKIMFLLKLLVGQSLLMIDLYKAFFPSSYSIYAQDCIFNLSFYFFLICKLVTNDFKNQLNEEKKFIFLNNLSIMPFKK